MFPLLKYDTSTTGNLADYFDQEELPGFTFSRHGIIVGGLAATVVTLLAVAVYFGTGGRPMDLPSKAPQRSLRTAVEQYSVAPAAPSAATAPVTTSRRTLAAQYSNPRPARPASAPLSIPPVQKESRQALLARLDGERAAREQLQRDQAALADGMRARSQQESSASQKAAGVDTIVPLDTNYPVDVGGSVLSVRIQDNDVTSFDAWVNGLQYRQVPKNKGLNGSRTEETLIYNTGRASLYYVWELSGQLNHCRLRVRQN